MPSTPRFKASVPRHPRKARLFILALVLISVLFSLCTIWYILLGWSSWRTFLDAPQTVVPTRDFEVLGRSALNLSLDEASSFSSVTASIAVVLPVTLPSVAGIRRALSDILVAIPSSSEIVLVVSPTLQVAVRDILRLMLSSEDGLDQIDISIHTWPSTSSEALATLSAARTVSSDWVAILGIHGLSKLDDAHKDALFSTTLTPLPLGVVGYDASLACIDPLEAPIPVQYLQPPFLAPTSLIPPLESIESRSTNLWRTFGEYVSSRRSDGFGGLLAGVHKSIGLSLCATLLDDDYLVDQQSSPSFAHQNDESKSLPISASHAVNTAIFAFPSLTDLRHLYPAICKLQQGSYSILALVVSGNSDHDLPANNIDSILHAKLGRCDVNITTSPQLLTVDDAKLILMEWFNKHPSPSLVVTPNQDHILLSALDLVLNQQPNLTLHRLRIPTLDLPFCDWMGTLSLSELQSQSASSPHIMV